MRRLSFLILLLVSASVCSAEVRSNSASNPPFQTQPITYIAIGDSYTIGEGASFRDCWPVQLAFHLRQRGVYIQNQKVLAKTGWATSDAIAVALPVYQAAKPQFATLMIGVNDWVRGISAEDFRKRLRILMDEMIKVLPQKNHLLVVNIPDFSVTPQGKEYAGGRDIAAGIAEFNKIIKEEAAQRGLPLIDIFPVSREMAANRSLIAADGLHPSAKTYSAWEQWIFPKAFEILKPATQ